MPEIRQTLRVDAHEFADQHETGPHTHDRHQLTYARSGVLTVHIETSRFVVPPFRAVWIPGGVVHSVRAHGSTSARLAFVDQSTDLLLPTNVAVIQVSPLLRAILEELRHDLYSDDRARPHLQALFALQIQQHEGLRDPASQPLHVLAMSDSRLAAIERELCERPSDRRTLRQWGHFCGSSERTLTRLFASETGTTFSQWRSQLRLQHAVIQLASGASVTDTANACGYNSTSAFIENFRSALGTTPGRFFESGLAPAS